MTRALTTIFLLVLLVADQTAAARVRLISKADRIDVEIDNRLFTSYRWDERYKRPVLLPVLTAGGAYVTRGFPYETRDGETIDHPHQVGLALSYGDVDGFDFWNNSEFRTPKELERMGRIVHRKVLKTKSGRRGELVVEADWRRPDGRKILTQTTRFVFRGDRKTRVVDCDATLTAAAAPVAFGDSKEGFFALRLARELEQKDQIGVKITDAAGNVSEAATGDDLTGEYLSSAGLAGDRVWGSTGKWAAVEGRLAGADVTVAVFDDPRNLNHPAALMVRGYGLLALNPFGRRAFDPKAEARKFVLEAGKSLRFRYRLLILPERAAPAKIDDEYRDFTG